jgi:hypothetical protein
VFFTPHRHGQGRSPELCAGFNYFV